MSNVVLIIEISKDGNILATENQQAIINDVIDVKIGVHLDDSRESTFLIQDMFPITEEYIEREYTLAGNHLMLTSEHAAREIEQKAKKVMGMLKRGIKFTPTQPDVIAILEKLRERR